MNGKLAILSVAVGAAAALALTSPPLSAQGNAYTLACPAGSAIIGLDGWQGWWMDGVRAVCQPVNVTTGTVGGSTRVTSVAGTAKGTRLPARCPAGHVLTGFTGSRGNYVLTIHSIHCSPVNPGGMAETQGVWRDAFPKKSGTGSFLANHCSGGQVATQIRGSAGLYLDRFTIDCEHLPGASQQVAGQPAASGPARLSPNMEAPRTSLVTPAAVTLLSPANGVQIRGHQSSDQCAEVDLIPSFRWQAVTGAEKYVLELRNVTRNRTRRFNNTTTRQATTRLMLIAGDSYTWRVQGVNALGTAGAWSAPRSIQAVAGAPSGSSGCVIGAGAYPIF